MANKSKKEYCHLTPDFPESAFMVVLFFSTGEVNIMTVPLSRVCITVDEALESISNFMVDFKKSKYGESATIFNAAILIPITFRKLFPLKKEYWTRQKSDPKPLDKVTAFVPALDKPNLYKLLVVPYGYIKKLNHWEFAAAYPFSVFSESLEIEKFMYASDQAVEMKAKYAALYSFGTFKKLDLKTGEVSEVIKEPPKTPKIVN